MIEYLWVRIANQHTSGSAVEDRPDCRKVENMALIVSVIKLKTRFYNSQAWICD